MCAYLAPYLLLATITLLTVDLDDTLWPCAPVIDAAESALYGWLQSVATRLTDAHDMASLREHRRSLVRARRGIAHDLTEVRRQSLEILLSEFGYPAMLADEGLRLFLDHRNRVEPYEDVRPVLAELSGRFRLVSITNGNAEVQRTPLRGVFHLSLCAAGVGAARPDPRLFLEALKRTGTAAPAALHVGDDPRLDVQAAASLGMRTAWVNRSGREWPEELPRPDVELSDLWQLPEWLGGR